jgi:NB-ARC domain
VQAGNISGGVHFHDPAPQNAPRPRQLPGNTRGFVNRAGELRSLDVVLSDGDGEPVAVYVIAGTPGAGKTSLALRWAHRVANRFPDGQLYVNLRGYDPGEPVTPQQALHRFLVALGTPADTIPAALEDAAALYRSILADRRMLVVLDNAATTAQVRPLLPGAAHSLVIITSRTRLSGLAIREGAQHLTLNTLSEVEAVELLRAVTAGHRRDDSTEQLAELARLCACLPLALRIAAERAASHPHRRLDELIGDLRDESALWQTLSAEDGEAADAVRTVFAWSYRALPADAARMFRLLGLHPGPAFGLGAVGALAGVDMRTARQLLDTLVGAHLLEHTGADRFEFHDLLRAFAADQSRREEPPESRAAALRSLLAGWATAAVKPLRGEASARPITAWPATRKPPPIIAKPPQPTTSSATPGTRPSPSTVWPPRCTHDIPTRPANGGSRPAGSSRRSVIHEQPRRAGASRTT